MTRISLPLLCECLLFFVPLNIYGIGNNLATGVQWALFRYQRTILETACSSSKGIWTMFLVVC